MAMKDGGARWLVAPLEAGNEQRALEFAGAPQGAEPQTIPSVRQRLPALRPVSGPGRPPPGSMELPLAAPERLWLAIHLTDAAQLNTVATHCYRFTSLVSLEPPDGVLLEVQGSLRLFGGAQALVRRIGAELKEQGIEARLAAAPTPTASMWLSRLPREGASAVFVPHTMDLPRRLSSLPLHCLRWPEKQTTLLASLGVSTLGELMRLPRAGLTRRLGAQWLAALDNALDRRADPRHGFMPAERYTDVFEPEAPIANTQWLETLIVSRLEALQDFLRSHQAAIGTLSFQLRHQGHPASRLRVALATPCGEITPLIHLLREQLAALKLCSSVVGVRVRSGPLFALSVSSASLMQKMDARFQAEAAALPRLVERLRARLGTEAVAGIRAAADHRPEKAWKRVDALAREKDTPLPVALVRPLWLCSAPAPLTAASRARLTLERGPERIESGWWDGEDVTRDYCVMRKPDGARVWVYRERKPPHGWYVHGYFG